MAKAVASINLADGAEANSNAKRIATNYLASDSTGIMVAELSGSSETPSTATGNNVRITSTTVDVRKGQNNLTTMGQSGMQVYNGSGTQIANLGYGSTVNEQGQTVNAPYYDLGVRKANTVAGTYSVVEGQNNTASEFTAHAEGSSTTASGGYAHAEGSFTTASGQQSHAEGRETTASDYSAHAEGVNTTASDYASHAEGYYTTASGSGAHAEGQETTASGSNAHAEGYKTKATANYSHAEGEGSEANGVRSHAQGLYTKTSETNGTVLGKYNSSTSGYAIVVGGGNDNSNRRDIFTMDWNGYISAPRVVTTTKAVYNGNASGVTNFWNSAITTRTTADLYRIGNTVFCYLRFTSPSSVSSGQAIATIPSGYRPNHTCCFTASIAWENNNNAPITVGTGGAVAFVNTAFTASKSYIVCGTWLTDDNYPT